MLKNSFHGTPYMKRSEYELLQKSHQLPKFEDMDAVFDLGCIERPELREVRKKVEEKIELVLEILNTILQPDTNSYSDMYECRYFSESEKEDIHHLFKQVMIIDRRLLEAEIASDEKVDAAVIREAHILYGSVKPQMLRIIVKMRDAWSQAVARSPSAGYVG